MLVKRNRIALIRTAAVVCALVLGARGAILVAQPPPSYPPPAFEYVVKGKMIGGFALIAWPAEYGVSAVQTLMIRHHGIVYEKDL
ncbi:MAG TPA: DUF2950 family protein, partial [Candidatus Acidoferrales bacterium]|nr:DUF2950 family protein [Candidatus Acidoferrales bacterium]